MQRINCPRLSIVLYDTLLCYKLCSCSTNVSYFANNEGLMKKKEGGQRNRLDGVCYKVIGDDCAAFGGNAGVGDGDDVDVAGWGGGGADCTLAFLPEDTEEESLSLEREADSEPAESFCLRLETRYGYLCSWNMNKISLHSLVLI